MTVIHPIAFAAGQNKKGVPAKKAKAGKRLPVFTPPPPMVAKRKPLLFELKPRDLEWTKIDGLPQKGPNEPLALLQLKPEAIKRYLEQFQRTGGAVVIEGLKDFLPEPATRRRLHLGLARQLSEAPDVARLCGLSQVTTPFNLRIVGQNNRGKEQVDHVDEVHYDCGPQDTRGCSDNNDVHALLIADNAFKGYPAGTVTRLLASTQDLKDRGAEEASVYPKAPNNAQLAAAREFNPNSGLLFFTSNVNDPSTGMHRWAHWLLPADVRYKDVDRLTRYPCTGLTYQQSDHCKSLPFRVYPDLMATLSLLGVKKSEFRDLEAAFRSRGRVLAQNARSRQVAARKAVREAKKARLQEVLSAMKALRTTKRLEPLQAELKALTTWGPQLVSAEQRLAESTIGSDRYDVRAKQVANAVFRKWLPLKLSDCLDEKKHPYGLFQLTTRRASNQEEYERYVVIGETSRY